MQSFASITQIHFADSTQHVCLCIMSLTLLQFPNGISRSMEDIKARYYAVARQLLVGREGTEDSVANNVLVKHPFNLTHERYDLHAVSPHTICTLISS